MHQPQAEIREQVRRERVPERLRLPSGLPRVLRLLEVVRDRVGVDAQQAQLAWRLLLARVVRWGAELSFEVLRQSDADRLLRVATRVERGARRIERVREQAIHVLTLSVAPVDDR